MLVLGASWVCNDTTTLIAQADGTAIGDMTSGGGLAAAFDGDKTQTNTLCANVASAVGYCGKTWGTGVSHVVTRVKTWGANDANVNGGYVTGSDPSVTITIQGSNDAFASEIVALGSTTFTDTQDESTPKDFNMTDISRAFLSHRAKIDSGAGAQVNLAEIEFYGC